MPKGFAYIDFADSVIILACLSSIYLLSSPSPLFWYRIWYISHIRELLLKLWNWMEAIWVDKHFMWLDLLLPLDELLDLITILISIITIGPNHEGSPPQSEYIYITSNLLCTFFPSFKSFVVCIYRCFYPFIRPRAMLVPRNLKKTVVDTTKSSSDTKSESAPPTKSISSNEEFRKKFLGK